MMGTADILKCDHYIRAIDAFEEREYDWCGIRQAPCWFVDKWEMCSDYKPEEPECNCDAGERPWRDCPKCEAE